MVKRKRQAAPGSEAVPHPTPNKKSKATGASKANGTPRRETESLQIVVGSYDQVLHGLTATVKDDGNAADFADTFLFNAHNSAIRCVAVSPASAPVPGQTQKVLLASGSTDERINIYNLSAHPPRQNEQEALSKVAPRPIRENRHNRELGTLLHHASTVTALSFPTRSKLLTASEDSTLAVARTRDWSVLSTIKAPVPKAEGRPSGDTAALGATPAGVNDFAVHPSMKLMISVSRGEKCMRLWNLVTGKKAGVLSFSRGMLTEVGEGKHATGEGRRVVWGSTDGADEFAVGFDRDIVVFGMDSVPKCRVMGSARTKVHQFAYVLIGDGSLLAVATEDGRIVLFSTRESDLTDAPTTEADSPKKAAQTAGLKSAKLVGSVGGKADGVVGRIKDFVALPSQTNDDLLYLAAGSSDGKVRLWTLRKAELAKKAKGKSSKEDKPLGKLLGTYETQNRITCLAGYVMIARPDGAESEDEEEESEDEDTEEDSE